MKCKTILKIGGHYVIGSANGGEYASDEELDQALYQRRTSLFRRYKIKDSLKTFDTENEATAGITLNDSKQHFIDGLSTEEQRNAASIAMKMNEKTGKWKGEIVDRLERGIDTRREFAIGTTDLIHRFALRETRSINSVEKNVAEKGTEFHKAVQNKINVLNGEPTIAYDKRYITDAGIARAEAVADTIINEIKRKHPNATILSESAMFTTHMNANFVRYLQDLKSPIDDFVSPESGIHYPKASNEVSWINGVADILVIEPNGNTYLYDIKTSTNKGFTAKAQTFQNSRSQLYSNYYTGQLRAYENMLTMAGLHVMGSEIIAINRESTDDDEKLDNASLFIAKTGNDNGFYKAYGNKNIKATVDSFFASTAVRRNLDMPNGIKLIDTLVPIKSSSKAATFYEEQRIKEMKAYRKKETSDGEKQANGGKSWKVVHLDSSISPTGTYVAYFDTEEQADQFIENYAPLEVAKRKDKFVDMANEINQYMRGDISLNDLSQNFRIHYGSNANKIISAIKRFRTITGWQLDSNDQLLAEGILLFTNPSEGVAEVIELTNHIIDGKIDFSSIGSNRSTIMGGYLRDNEADSGKNNTATSDWILPGTFGSREALKVACVFATSPEILGNCKLQGIKVVNVFNGQILDVPNSRIIKNFDALELENTISENDEFKNLSIDHLFLDDATAAINKANQIFMIDGIDHSPFESERWAPANTYGINDLLERMKQLAFKSPEGNLNQIDTFTTTNEYAEAYYELCKALLSLYGFYVEYEEDISDIIGRGVPFSGTTAAAGNVALSYNQRVGQSLINLFWNKIKQDLQKEVWGLQNAFEECFKEDGVTVATLATWDYFGKNFFEQKDGKIHEDFRLKKPTDPSLKPHQKKCLEIMIDLIKKYKYEGNRELIKQAESTGELYDCPLFIADTKQRLYRGDLKGSIKDFFKPLLEYANQFGGMVVNDSITAKGAIDTNRVKIPNLFEEDSEQRGERLNKGTARYSTDLQTIFTSMVLNGVMRRDQQHLIPVVAAFRTLVHVTAHDNGAQMSKIEEAISKNVSKNLFGNNIIDDSNKWIAAVMGKLAGLTSFTTLAFRSVGLARETIQGIKKTAERAITQDQSIGRYFTPSEYANALAELARDLPTNFGRKSLLNQLNRRYGMANFGSTEVVDRLKVNKGGLLSMSGDIAFITATWPDFLHRNALLIAAMKHLGCFDAYSLDDNEVLKYDMSKDDRYKTVYKYLDKISEEGTIDIEEIDKADRDAFVIEFLQYKEAIDSWKESHIFNSEGREFKYGDKLEDAFAPKEVQSMKTIADFLYGNYDSESKSLLHAQLFGKIFFQYKTFTLSTLTQRLKPNAKVNSVTWKTLKDTDGDDLCYVFHEDGTKEVKKASEVDQELFTSGKAALARYPSQLYIGGNAQATFTVARAIMSLDQEKFNEAWKNNGQFRAQVYLSLIDLFGMLIMAWFCKAIYGEDDIQDMKNQEWYERWSYAVLNGITEDGTTWSVLKSIYGDGKPPMVGVLQNYYYNAYAVITGRKNILNGLMSSYGMTKEFSNLANTD